MRRVHPAPDHVAVGVVSPFRGEGGQGAAGPMTAAADVDQGDHVAIEVAEGVPGLAPVTLVVAGGVKPAAVEDGQEFIGPVVGAGGTAITGAPDVLAAEAGDGQARCRGIGEILEELDKAVVAVLVVDVLDVERVGDDLLHAAGAVVVEVLLAGDLAAGAEVGALGLDQPPVAVVEVALDPGAGGDGEEVALGVGRGAGHPLQ